MGNAWSPNKVPDVSDPNQLTGGAGNVIAPGGIVSAEAFGSAIVTVSVDLSSFFTGGTVLQSVQSDKGITTGATFTWTDQSGNSKHYTQSTAGKQPSLTAGLNGNPGLSFTFGAATLLASALNLPAPGTTPTWMGIVWRNITPFGNARPLCSTDGLTAMVYMSAADTKLQQYSGNGGNIDLGVTAGTWTCDEFYFSNSASDYIKRGSAAPVTGTGAGNSISTGRNIGGSDATANYMTAEVMHVIYVTGKQVSAIANWRSAIATKYAGGVQT